MSLVRDGVVVVYWCVKVERIVSTAGCWSRRWRTCGGGGAALTGILAVFGDGEVPCGLFGGGLFGRE
jgi:hypothetical protein